MLTRDLLLLLGAGVGAGAINSMAGGGTLLSFPALVLLGRDPIIANATNAVALCPGSLASAFGFRRELAASRELRWPVLLPSLLGGVLGAWLLLATPSSLFSTLVPYLILGATLLIALKRPLLSLRRPAAVPAAPAPAAGAPPAGPAPVDRPRFGLGAIQFLVAVYGGYFGAGMGILMLAVYGLLGLGDIHRRNAWKNLAATIINAVAALVFIARGAVHWGDAALLGVGAIVGGFAGAQLGRRLSPRVAEGLVVAVGLGAAVLHFVRR